MEEIIFFIIKLVLGVFTIVGIWYIIKILIKERGDDKIVNFPIEIGEDINPIEK